MYIYIYIYTHILFRGHRGVREHVDGGEGHALRLQATKTMCCFIGCGQMGSTLMGPLQKESILTDWVKRYALTLLGR